MDEAGSMTVSSEEGGRLRSRPPSLFVKSLPVTPRGHGEPGPLTMV